MSLTHKKNKRGKNTKKQIIPHILYHGTPHNITHLESRTPRGHTQFNTQTGIYLTSNKIVAELYALARDIERKNKSWAIYKDVLLLSREKWHPQYWNNTPIEKRYKLNNIAFIYAVKSANYKVYKNPNVSNEFLIKKEKINYDNKIIVKLNPILKKHIIYVANDELKNEQLFDKIYNDHFTLINKQDVQNKYNKLRKLIILVNGIPGSGKSYIGSQLMNIIKWVDTDNYITQAYEQLIIKNSYTTPLNEDNVFKLAQKMLEKDIHENSSILITGTTLPIPDTILNSETNIIHSYFIKLNASDLHTIYKRTLLREIQKYKSISSDKEQQFINKLPYNHISYYLAFKHHINAIEPTETTFKTYKNMYQNNLKHVKNNKIYNNILTQNDIIEKIKENIDNYVITYTNISK